MNGFPTVIKDMALGFASGHEWIWFHINKSGTTEV